MVIADAQGTPAAPQVFVHLADEPVAGVTIDGERMILGAQFGVWELPYHTGDRSPRGTPRQGSRRCADERDRAPRST